MVDTSLDDLIRKELTGDTSVTEAIKQLFRDEIEVQTGKHSIDLKTDLTEKQAHLIARLDFFTHLGVFRNLDMFTHDLKRNLVSKDRKGRDEAVRMGQSNLNTPAQKAGFFSKIFGKKPGEQ